MKQYSQKKRQDTYSKLNPFALASFGKDGQGILVYHLWKKHSFIYTYIENHILNQWSTLRDFISGPTWKSMPVSKILTAHSRWNWSPILCANSPILLIILFPFLFRNCFKERCQNQIYSGDRLLQVWETRLSFRF